MSVVTEDYDSFETKNGKTYYLVNFVKPDNLLVWQDGETNYGCSTAFCSSLKVVHVEPEELKRLKVWDKLSKETQEKIVNHIDEHKQAKVDRMGHARRGRKEKFPNIPENLTCCKCGEVEKAYPSQTAKKIEKLDVTVEKYLEEYECGVCQPRTRGRKANPKNVPTDLVCKCGNKVTYPLNMIVKRAEDKNMNVTELIEGYRCQSCCPIKRGRKKKE